MKGIEQIITNGLQYDSIPLERVPSSFYKIDLQGWKIKISLEDEEFNHFTSLCGLIAKDFIRRYAKTHMLSFEVGFKYTGECFLKIFMLEKKEDEMDLCSVCKNEKIACVCMTTDET